MNELNLGGAKGAVTLRSKSTGVNDPHSEDNLTPEKTYKVPVTRWKAGLPLFGRCVCAV